MTFRISKPDTCWVSLCSLHSKTLSTVSFWFCFFLAIHSLHGSLTISSTSLTSIPPRHNGVPHILDLSLGLPVPSLGCYTAQYIQKGLIFSASFHSGFLGSCSLGMTLYSHLPVASLKPSCLCSVCVGQFSLLKFCLLILQFLLCVCTTTITALILE